MIKERNFFTAAISGLILASACASQPEAEKTAEADSNVNPSEVIGECHGINACKGQGACGAQCAGTNSCKGKGFVKKTKAECLAQKGQFKEW